MILSIKICFKKLLSYALIILTLFMLFYFAILGRGAVSGGNIDKINFTIVLDAGHGGMDGGVEGVKTHVKESEINLKIVKKLEKYLTSVGFKVVLTRKNEEGLYNKFGRNYKIEDMEKRKEIILKSRANMVVSIQLNSFPDRTLAGAQALYDVENTSGKLLADTIQQELIKQLPNARKNSNYGDYYILKCTQNPSVLVECGFLTNEQEEALLITDEYQQKVAYAIFCGILRYFYNI